MATDPSDAREIQKAFRRKFLRRLLVMVLTLPAVILWILVYGGDMPTVLGIKASHLLILALLVAVAAAVYSYVDWRCPSCGGTFGRAFYPQRCPQCRVRLHG